MKLGSNRFIASVLLAVLLVGALGACTGAPDAGGGDQLQVTVSIVPQRYFVERIGGEHVAVSVMVEPGASPATYEPKPEQLRALSEAAAYFSIGVPFEGAWLDKIAETNQDMVMVDTIADIERMPMGAHHHREEGEADDHHHEEEEGEADDHDHEEGEHEADDHDHVEGAPDPHVWLSPALVKVQSQAIADALIELDPDHADDYQANLDTFLGDIDDLMSDIDTTLAGLETRTFMVFHPAWGYFADDFDLEQIPVEVGGQEPSAQELARLIEEAQEEGIRFVFAQPEFSTGDAETIAKEIGGEVLLISPLAPDWLANMRSVADAFAEALGTAP